MAVKSVDLWKILGAKNGERCGKMGKTWGKLYREVNIWNGLADFIESLGAKHVNLRDGLPEYDTARQAATAMRLRTGILSISA